MYAWQQHKTFTSQMLPGDSVMLNPRWSGYNYLKREFGHLFPSAIAKVNDDIIVVGKHTFARQVLAFRREAN